MYIHFKADSLIPFYIGKGCGGRYKNSVRRNQYWHNVVNKHGFVPDILEYFEDEQDAYDYEVEMIKFFRDNGFALTNIVDGGGGVHGFKHSPEAKAKMSSMRAGEGNAMFGKAHTDETRAKISEAHKGRKRPPRSAEYRAKISKVHKGKTLSIEARAKISAAHKGKKRQPMSEEAKIKIGNAHRGVPKPPKSPEHSAKISAAITGVNNPRFKGFIVATNILTGEKIRLCGYKEMKAANFNPGAVYACLSGKEKQHKGFTFIREPLVKGLDVDGGESCLS